MRKINIFALVIFWMASAHSAEITYTFANEHIISTTPKYLEFDIMANAGEAGIKLGDAQILVNYKTATFGDSISLYNIIVVTKGTLLQGGTDPNYNYRIINVADYSESCFAITTEFVFPLTPAIANEIPTIPTQLAHVRLEIANSNQSPGISFVEVVMENQTYTSNNTSQFDDVIATDAYDNPISVTLVSFTATSVQNSIIIEWQTASEINIAGYNIYRSTNADSAFTQINGALIPSNVDDRTNGAYYKYADFPNETALFYYKLQTIELGGAAFWSPSTSVQFETIVQEIKVPEKFDLNQNYPNPFNPMTTIQFQVPYPADVEMHLYNLKGQRIRTLLNNKIAAGYQSIIWDATNDQGALVASGVYILQMKSEAFVKQIKLSLLR